MGAARVAPGRTAKPARERPSPTYLVEGETTAAPIEDDLLRGDNQGADEEETHEYWRGTHARNRSGVAMREWAVDR